MEKEKPTAKSNTHKTLSSKEASFLEINFKPCIDVLSANSFIVAIECAFFKVFLLVNTIMLMLQVAEKLLPNALQHHSQHIPILPKMKIIDNNMMVEGCYLM